MRAQSLIFVLACCAAAASAFSPLQFERQRGFPSHSHASAKKSGNELHKAFTKARLPTTAVLPVSYDLFLTPILDAGVGSFEQWTAPGAVTIIVNATALTTTITLNSVGLTIDGASVTVLL
jgi:hypothetical protein